MDSKKIIAGLEVALEQLDNWGISETIGLVQDKIFATPFVVIDDSQKRIPVEKFVKSKFFRELYVAFLWNTVKRSKDIRRKVVFPGAGQLLYDEILPLQKDFKTALNDVIKNNGSLESFFEEIITGS